MSLIEEYYGSFASWSNPLATEFDGVNDRVDYGVTSNLISAAQGSISIRLKVLALTANKYIFADVDGYVKLYVVGSQFTFGIWDGGNKLTAVGAAITTNTDYHLVCTWSNGSPVKLYMNGALYATGAVNTGNIQNLTFNFNVGGYVNLVAYANCRVNTWEAWNDDLTLAECAELYSVGNPSAVSFAAKLTHSYRMGNGDTYPTITDRTGIRNGTMTNMSAANFVTY